MNKTFLKFDDSIIHIIVKYTNQYIATVKDTFFRETYAKEGDFKEIYCQIGLIFLAGEKKSNRLNVEELFRTDGGSIEIFRLLVSAQCYRFLLRVFTTVFNILRGRNVKSNMFGFRDNIVLV